ncbi:hypothetical protein H633G_11498 [Metarhizium anisopliae BRIP 53284]|nr:hypothetical protein H633G_11498 [Metarhizium anisopliae BRIP 53284]
MKWLHEKRQKNMFDAPISRDDGQVYEPIAVVAIADPCDGNVYGATVSWREFCYVFKN